MEVSPMRAVELGEAAHVWGIGRLQREWACCPRWHAEFSEVTLDGVDPLLVLSRAARFAEKGELGSYIEPPWTEALLSSLELDQRIGLEVEREAALKAQRGRDRKETLQRRARGRS